MVVVGGVVELSTVCAVVRNEGSGRESPRAYTRRSAELSWLSRRMRAETLGRTSMYEPWPFTVSGPALVLMSQLQESVLSCVPSKRSPPTRRRRLKLTLFITYPAVTRSTRSKLLLLPNWGAVWVAQGPETVSNKLLLALKYDWTLSQLIPGPYE